MTDFQITNDGSLLILVPQSDAATDWVEENIGEDNGYQPYWPSVVIEPRYAGDILSGIEGDGLTVR